MEVKIIKYDDLGNGICKINDKVCFVEKAMPYELLNIKLVKEKKHFMMGKIIDIIKANPERIKPICPFYKKCGGCNFLHMTEEEEVRFKCEKAKTFFEKFNGFINTNLYNYRNKVVLHVKNGNIGFYEEKSNEIVPITYCYLLDEKINEIIELLLNYHDEFANGNILIRVSDDSQTLVSFDGKFGFIDTLKEESLIDNLIYNEKIIKGKDYFIDYVLDYKFKVSYKSFFQVNRLGLIKIIELLEDYFKDKKINTSLDLYSGTSVLGIILSKYSKKVISVEENCFATKDAISNLELNKINNLEVINSKVENVINKFLDIDLIILDPARRGLDLKTIGYLKKIKAKHLIYIACSMDSLKRELMYLKEFYNLEAVKLIDMFPRTNNVESMAFLRLK